MRSKFFAFALTLAIGCCLATPAFAQTDTVTARRRLPPVEGLVKNVFFMPYITGSMNLHSGRAFSKSATGIGYGFGVAFDLTEDGQKTGFYFDMAFQDMRAGVDNGTCMNDLYDTLLTNARAEHYYQYVLLETFLKLQGAKSNGYFLLGTSLGYNVTATTLSDGVRRDQYSNWRNLKEHNLFRLDLRAGLGLILANLGTEKLILEARVGYPVTAAISDLRTFCDDTGQAGDWRIVSLQANLGVRF